jgi:hypothetical protein
MITCAKLAACRAFLSLIKQSKPEKRWLVGHTNSLCLHVMCSHSLCKCFQSMSSKSPELSSQLASEPVRGASEKMAMCGSRLVKRRCHHDRVAVAHHRGEHRAVDNSLLSESSRRLRQQG